MNARLLYRFAIGTLTAIGLLCLLAGAALMVMFLQGYDVTAWLFANRYAFFGATSGAGFLGLIALGVSEWARGKTL